ncbi:MULTISPECIES: Nramp family divalent metal transporter [Galbibacter]|uniref:Mn2+/Fe2_transporter, NRAMP family n=1 Tax=Galbibacter orientalis DSM 19592 TaxID=926559 RepID=I3C3G8_9FLAO|nr:Nramp family divalent metal transporter [Galbibacter orientalis]EIJ38161.1 Mn2+/Fe2_ transporter, NRAMP family [Galbibacter orientalis DSM 19592]
MFKKVGPGVLVAAAFIGPGTVTTCMLTGNSFGFSLLWAMLFSIIATIFLQEMAARIGIITQKGLGDVVATEIYKPWLRWLVITLILGAIVIGNTAYEGGNIGGATLGLQALFGTEHSYLYPLIIGSLAFIFLYIGKYKTIEKILVALVILMSISFILTAIVTKPNIIEILKGLFIPTAPKNSLLSIIALVGTTIVPYNLFLHASLVSKKWNKTTDLKYAQRDTILSISLGGLVSIAIMITAAKTQSLEIKNVLDLAIGLEPIYGNSAKYFMGIGLFAAGLTSAITAPLAAAFVANSCFGWGSNMQNKRFKAVWMFIIILGVILMSFGIKPIEVIKLAQIANGILLPIITIFLLWAVNRTSILKTYKNTLIQNIIGIIIVVLTLGLGIMSVLKVFGIQVFA